MIPYNDIYELVNEKEADKNSCKLFTDIKFMKECNCGITVYSKLEYNKPGVHEDTEIFYVIQGEGTAKIGDEEIAIKPGIAFAALPKQPHCIRTNSVTEPVIVFWFHK